MKAIVKRYREKGLWLENVPTPVPAPYEVLIRTKKASICGTDLHIYEWDAWAQQDIHVPVVIGHEGMGEIAALGEAVEGLSVGQRVSCEGHLNCGICRNCRTGTAHLCAHTIALGRHRDGLFAEYFTVPARNAYPLPDTISDEEGALLDPLGNAVHTALCFPLIGEDVLITGAGPIGLMAVAIAKQAGARCIVITDRIAFRLKLAKKLGASATVNIDTERVDDAVQLLGIAEGFGVGLEMSGSNAGLNTLLEWMQPAGKVALLGILPPGTAINWDLVIFRGLTLRGIYGREMYRTWDQMTRLLQSGLDVTPIITHRYGFAEFAEAFAAITSGVCGKIVLHW